VYLCLSVFIRVFVDMLKQYTEMDVRACKWMSVFLFVRSFSHFLFVRHRINVINVLRAFINNHSSPSNSFRTFIVHGL